MSIQHQEFRGRVSRLKNKHGALSQGYAARIQKDGLIVVEPRRVRSRFSGRFLVLFLLAFLAFKVFLMAGLGFATYDERVERLAEGTAIERIGAVVMLSDPLSHWAAEKIGPILR